MRLSRRTAQIESDWGRNMNLLTVIILLIFAISALRGYRKGFIKSLASMASIVLSVVLVNFAVPHVTDFLKTHTAVYDYITERCEQAFSVSDSADRLRLPEGALGGSAGSLVQTELIESLPLPYVLKKMLKENNTQQYYTGLAVNSFAEYVPKYLAGLILNIVSFVATWVLVIAMIWLAVRTLNTIAGLPILNGINRALGLALGLLQGLIIVWIAFLMITLFINTDIGRQLMDMIAESPFLNALYERNILLDFLTNLLGNLG